jgi:acetyl esterase/lipase
MARLSLNHINYTRLWAVWAFILLLGLPLVANAQSNIAYRPSLGAASPALDVYTKTSLKNAPVLVYVHGGGWQIGDKSRVNAKPKYFNRQGFVFVSINYRLFPDVNVENQLQDVDNALRWVARNIADYGGDPGNISLMGHSAGAHLAAMTGVRPLASARELISGGALRAVISNDTRAYDVARIAKGARGGKLPKLYASVFGQDPVRWDTLSPIKQIKRGKPLPAFLILYSGQGDDDVRRSFATDFASALQGAGGQADLYDGSRLSHAAINKQIGRPNSLTRKIDTFLKAQSR